MPRFIGDFGLYVSLCASAGVSVWRSEVLGDGAVLCYSVVTRGMAWHDVTWANLWYGVVKCSVVHRAVLCFAVMWRSMVQGMWCGVESCCMVWCGVVSCGVVWCGVV